MLSTEDLWRDGFTTIMREMGREAVHFRAFRRFRAAILQASECRELLIDYWMGHSNAGMGGWYTKQSVENRKFRAEWAKPVVSEPVAPRVLQNPERAVEA